MATSALNQAIRQIAVTSTLESEEIISALLETLFETTPSTAIKNGAQEAVTSVFVEIDHRSPADLKRQIRERITDLEANDISVGPLTINVRKVKKEDWSESWKRHFQPIEINQRLLVVPPWSRRKARAGQATVVLDPGMSFGTGNHPTTLFCLRQIAELDHGDTRPSCLDIGTGSGILAIAAAKLGYAPIKAFDNDPDAVQSAQQNAERNEVAPQIEIYQDTLESLPLRTKDRYTNVFANLTHDLLKAHAKRIVAQLHPVGTLCLAGILIEQFAAVQAIFEDLGLTCVDQETLNEWKSGAFRKH